MKHDKESAAANTHATAPSEQGELQRWARRLEAMAALVRRAQRSTDPEETATLEALRAANLELRSLLGDQVTDAESAHALDPYPARGGARGGHQAAPRSDDPNTNTITESQPSACCFIMDSMLIRRAYDYVCGEEASPLIAFREVFTYLTGFPLNATTYVVTQLVPVRFAEQSAIGVRVENGSNIQTLAALDDIGLPLVAHCHSHPGHGPEANRPSHVDHQFQARLERGGHICIGLIFSRSRHPGEAFLRLFAGDGREFHLQIHGHRVEEIAHHVYRLDLAHGPLSLDPPGTARSLRIGR